MTGRRAMQVLRGAGGRGVREAVALALSAPDFRAPVGTVASASSVAPCPQCGGALRFDSDHRLGRALEECTQCGHRAAVTPQTRAQVAAQEQARRAALLAASTDASAAPARIRHCARCAAPLPTKRVGVRGARFCKDRAACLRAAEGKRPRRVARAIAFAEASAKLTTALPATRSTATTVVALCAATGLTQSQARTALAAMIRAGAVCRAWLDERRSPVRGRPPMGYWRAA